MLHFKWPLALFASACFFASASAQDADKAAGIAKARSCDDAAAMAFAQLANETAEAVATAAFEKCRGLWREAVKWTQAGLRASPYLLAESLRNPDGAVDGWQRPEVRRLLVVVMEARLKGGHPQ
jgi:hypothetical protein